MKHELRNHHLLLIDPQRWEARCRIVDEFARDDFEAEPGSFKAGTWWEEEDIFGDPLPKMQIADGIATIPVKGVIACGLPKIFKAFGYVDTQEVAANIDKAGQNPEVSGIVLDIASPGGTVGGVMELADRVAREQESGKSICAFTSDLACSAAYWTAAGASGIFATRSAEVGSIGVYQAIYDDSKAFEMFGYKVEIIKAGRLKAIGHPGTSLTEEQRQHLQEGVNEIYGAFTAHIKKYRYGVQPEHMQGQAFMAERAKEIGLIDDVVDGIEAVRSFAKR